MPWVIGIYMGVFYSYRREVRVARFGISGQFSGALDSEASDGWASRFLFICLLTYLFVASMRSPIVHLIHNVYEKDFIHACRASVYVCKL